MKIEFINTILNISKDNPIIATIISLYGVTLISFFLKSVPAKILAFLKKHLTTTLTISSTQACFIQLMTYLEKASVVNKVRNIKFLNGRWGNNSIVNKSIGPGTHLIWLHGSPAWVTVSSKDTMAYDEKLNIEILKLGRSHKLFDHLQKEFSAPEPINEKTTKVYKWFKDCWQVVTEYPSRRLSSVFIEEQKKNLLLSTIKKFLDSEESYLSRGIPYQLGILLEGPPGTGKTSLIGAIAGYFHRNICILPSSDLMFLQNATSSLPDNSFMIIEDVDANCAVHQRNKPKKVYSKSIAEKANKDLATPSDRQSQIDDEMYASYQSASLSDILNGMDGLIRLHGRIMIMTTNHVEKLDKAFLREGRIDLKLNIGNATIETFSNFLETFFPGETKHRNIKNIISVSVSKLQSDFFKGKKYEDFIKDYQIV